VTGRTKIASAAWTTIALLTLLGGCAGGDYGASRDEAAPDDAAPSGLETPAVLDLTVEAQAVLAKADIADGAEDHVVAKCPGCNLAMEGSADHAAHVGDYELHFCSEDCSRRFQEDTNASILALAIP